MHKYLWIVVIALLWATGSAMAQLPSLGYSPFLQRGTHELALSGTFDFQNEGDALLVQFAEVRVRRQPGIENELLRDVSRIPGRQQVLFRRTFLT
jgi:hypothetical protein